MVYVPSFLMHFTTKLLKAHFQVWNNFWQLKVSLWWGFFLFQICFCFFLLFLFLVWWGWRLDGWPGVNLSVCEINSLFISSLTFHIICFCCMSESVCCCMSIARLYCNSGVATCFQFKISFSKIRKGSKLVSLYVFFSMILGGNVSSIVICWLASFCCLIAFAF